MLTFKNPARVVEGALILCAALTFGVATNLLSQQPQAAAAVTAPAAATVSAPATTPAPAASPLFAQTNENAPTLANAEAANTAAISEGGSHTIVVSTLVLVLAVVILVLLID
jgi:hypothetical protein